MQLNITEKDMPMKEFIALLKSSINVKAMYFLCHQAGSPVYALQDCDGKCLMVWHPTRVHDENMPTPVLMRGEVVLRFLSNNETVNEPFNSLESLRGGMRTKHMLGDNPFDMKYCVWHRDTEDVGKLEYNDHDLDTLSNVTSLDDARPKGISQADPNGFQIFSGEKAAELNSVIQAHYDKIGYVPERIPKPSNSFAPDSPEPQVLPSKLSIPSDADGARDANISLKHICAEIINTIPPDSKTPPLGADYEDMERIFATPEKSNSFDSTPIPIPQPNSMDDVNAILRDIKARELSFLKREDLDRQSAKLWQHHRDSEGCLLPAFREQNDSINAEIEELESKDCFIHCKKCFDLAPVSRDAEGRGPYCEKCMDKYGIY